ncbi:CLUMA_CG016539, isoform A [Clunio marinus]|uniref:CLUMA_CG016539, isoform A n=1 Tax=Clunio marinus TaxID=568069 RepID=A0A1J1ISH8_9DIPT|nr:CLUMA_CG016539, isoform A [Clunio marinus]
MRCLLLQVIVFCGVQALENPVPSSHLPPRNFNPHPYQNSVFYSPSDFQNYERKFEELSRRFQNPQARINNRIDDDYQEDVVDLIKSSSRSFDKKHYKFSYAVKDGKSGDDFSHTQKQENGAVQGSYKVHLPDGRVQIVKYTADDIHGYRAEVSYEGEANIHQPTNLLAPAQHTYT